MTSDGHFGYVWDEADRLKEVRRGDEVVMRCRHDGLGRRRERVMLESSTGVPPVYSTNRYVYDGWLVVAVLDGDNEVLEQYVHGVDLSGDRESAGGIGGILADFRPLTSDLRYFHYDGNGNVTAVTDADGAIVTRLEYDPFGRVLLS